MKKTILISFALAFFAVFATAQEVVTYTTDTIGPNNVQITTITTFQRPDSTISETRQSVRFKSRGEAIEYVSRTFSERITADSLLLGVIGKRLALLRASKAALTYELSVRCKKSAPVPVVTPPPPTKKPPEKKKKKG